MYNNLFSLTRTSAAINGASVAVLAASTIIKLPSLTMPQGESAASQLSGTITVSISPIFIVFLGVAIGIFGVVFNVGAALVHKFLRHQIYLVAKVIIEIEYREKIDAFTSAIDPKYLTKSVKGEQPNLEESFYRGRVYYLTWMFFFLACFLWVFFGLVVFSLGCPDISLSCFKWW